MGIITFTYPRTPKSIGGFEIDAFISEHYSFSNTVTEFPVEDGSVINDHVTSETPVISVEAFIGKTKFETWDGDIPDSIDDLPVEDPKARIKQAYYELKKLYENKQPVTVVLGLDTFTNMVITLFEIDRTVETGADLAFNMTLKKVRITKSKMTTISSSIAGGDQTDGIANGGVLGLRRILKTNEMINEWRQAYLVSGGTFPTKEEFFEKWGKYP